MAREATFRIALSCWPMGHSKWRSALHQRAQGIGRINLQLAIALVNAFARALALRCVPLLCSTCVTFARVRLNGSHN